MKFLVEHLPLRTVLPRILALVTLRSAHSKWHLALVRKSFVRLVLRHVVGCHKSKLEEDAEDVRQQERGVATPPPFTTHDFVFK